METFTLPPPFAAHPGYRNDRERSIAELAAEIGRNALDPPLLPLVRECIHIPHCFTVQCCYGHFVHALAPDPENLVPISAFSGDTGPIRYRVAYLALCLRDNPAGHRMYAYLQEMAGRNPAFVQFGSADWFLERMPNTYCLQLEPELMKTKDSGTVSWDEALMIEKRREPFFLQLMTIMQQHHTAHFQEPG